ncbi:MAG TPA: hypothetical protein VK639_11185 [Terriglobales bacterium]|nr:hypothetical protein [Terriglobales bacterium]
MWWKGMVSGWPVSAINGKDYFALDNRSACNLFPQNWDVPIIQKARWLDSMGTSMGVQRKLMRHAQIATTMNVYGNSMMENERAAEAALE